MKCLVIKDGKAYYQLKLGEGKLITDIGKEDLYELLELVIMKKDFDADIVNDDDFKIDNPVEQIIYTDLRKKLEAFHKTRETLIKEADDIFVDAYKKYKDELRVEPKREEIRIPAVMDDKNSANC